MFKQVIIFSFCLLFAVIVFLANCSDDKVVVPHKGRFEGIWQEVFYVNHGLDPGDFIFLDSNFIIDTGVYLDPGETIIIDSVIFRNDSLILIDTSGHLFYSEATPMTSVLEFVGDSFNLKINDSARVLKELAGRFRLQDNVIIFNVYYCWYYYWERFYPDFNVCDPYSDALYFSFLNDGSLKLRVIEIISDSGYVIVPRVGLPWSVPPFLGTLKTEGVFHRQ